jgi:N-acetylmuramoyl-L-alanine amidase
MLRGKIPRVLAVLGLFFLLSAAQSPMPPQAPGPSPATSPPAQNVSPAVPPAQSERPPSPAAVTVILDPAHGGADSGAHGDPSEEGAVEKDLVLTVALAMRRELEQQGVRVVLTRQTDTYMAINDRAALANGIGAGFFVSLHVGSSGEPNTAESYSFGTPRGGALPAYVPRTIGIDALPWNQAQSGYLVASRRFAELLQVELAQKLPHSPDVPQFAEVRQLRVVAHPAVAIELSSVAQEDPSSLSKTGVPLANALVRAIAAYRQPGGGRP